MRVFIQPVDTQFYRDGRPFDAGSESAGRANYLPSSRTIYGAFRAIILSNDSTVKNWQGWTTAPEIMEIIGADSKQMGSLGIRGPILAQDLSGGDLTNINLLYPFPKDIVLAKENSGACYLQLKPDCNGRPLYHLTNFCFNNVFPCTIAVAEDHKIFEEEKDVVLSGDYLDQYLSSNLSRRLADVRDSFKLSNFLQFEPRVGIGLDYKARTAQKNLLYSISHIRMANNVGLIVEIDNIDQIEDILPDEQLFRLGGDSRPVKYTKIKTVDRNMALAKKIKDGIKQHGRFKLYLITDAIFDNGWYPDFLSLQNNCLEGELSPDNLKARFRLVGACIGKPLYIGGFDIRERHPKIINKAVPAGSVYFFKFIDWENQSEDKREQFVSDLFSRFFYKTLSKNLKIEEQITKQVCSKEGFALTLIGEW